MVESQRSTTPTPLDLTIIIVSYNTREMTLACLQSVFAETRGAAFETIVVDNASTDGSAQAIHDAFPQVRLIARSDNLGFAAANNLAAREARGEYILLLNPDTVVLRGAIDKLLTFARGRQGEAICGGRTLFADGRLNPTSCWGRPTLWSAFCRGAGLSALFRGSRWFDPEALGGWSRDSVRQVDIVTGCFFLLRRDLWQRLGGFDPVFFMYGEEADLCLRAARQGVRCWITPDAEIVHYGGASERVRADKMVRLFRAKSQLYQRHWPPAAARWGDATLALWALTRLSALRIAQFLRPQARQSCETWRQIWRRRAEWRTRSAAEASSPAASPMRVSNAAALPAKGEGVS